MAEAATVVPRELELPWHAHGQGIRGDLDIRGVPLSLFENRFHRGHRPPQVRNAVKFHNETKDEDNTKLKSAYMYSTFRLWHYTTIL